MKIIGFIIRLLTRLFGRKQAIAMFTYTWMIDGITYAFTTDSEIPIGEGLLGLQTSAPGDGGGVNTDGGGGPAHPTTPH